MCIPYGVFSYFIVFLSLIFHWKHRSWQKFLPLEKPKRRWLKRKKRGKCIPWSEGEFWNFFLGFALIRTDQVFEFERVHRLLNGGVPGHILGLWFSEIQLSVVNDCCQTKRSSSYALRYIMFVTTDFVSSLFGHARLHRPTVICDKKTECTGLQSANIYTYTY